MATARLASGADPVRRATQCLRQQRGQPSESPGGIAEFDLTLGKPVQLGGFTSGASALTRDQITERNQPLEMSVGYGPVDANRCGNVGSRPFGLVNVEIEQDPPSRGILQRGDRSVDLGKRLVIHAGSLSTVPSATNLRTMDVTLLEPRRRAERCSALASWAANWVLVGATQAAATATSALSAMCHGAADEALRSHAAEPRAA
jgi:hypothetical protein